jgi:hypothetical protein
MKFSKIYPCGRDLQLSTKAADFFQLPKCSEFNGKNQIFPRLQNSAKILDICIKSQDFFCYWTKSRFCTCFKLKKKSGNGIQIWIFYEVLETSPILIRSWKNYWRWVATSVADSDHGVQNASNSFWTFKYKIVTNFAKLSTICWKNNSIFEVKMHELCLELLRTGRGSIWPWIK